MLEEEALALVAAAQRDLVALAAAQPAHPEKVVAPALVAREARAQRPVKAVVRALVALSLARKGPLLAHLQRFMVSGFFIS